MSPGTHPIRADVPDVAQAMANFDAITYAKGESVLKQLAAYVGEDAFVEGLRAYFRDNAWGNTRLDDLMGAVGRRRGPRPDRLDQRLAGPGRHRHHPAGRRRADGGVARTPCRRAPTTWRSAASPPPTTGWPRSGVASVETSGTRTEVDLPEADLHLVNADDLTFAAVRTDAASVRVLMERAGDLPDADLAGPGRRHRLGHAGQGRDPRGRRGAHPQPGAGHRDQPDRGGVVPRPVHPGRRAVGVAGRGSRPGGRGGGAPPPA